MGHAFGPVSLKKNQGWDHTLKNGLTNLWEFNGNANDIIGGVNLTSTGNVSYAPGKINNCLFFNGGYLYNTTIAINRPDWSVSFWVYCIPPTPGISGIICRSVGTGCYGFRTNSNYQINFVNGSNIYSTERVITLNNWIHICMVLNGNKLYVNGVEKSLTGTMSALNIGSPVYVGVDNYDLTNRKLYGYLEQLAIWNRGLTQAEVLKLYNNGKGLRYS